MKTICCACGKPIRMSIVLGNEGHELQGKAYACYACCKLVGYGKGVLGAMGTALMTREQFVQKYQTVIAQENLRKQEELEAKRIIKEQRQAKIDSAKRMIAKITNKQEKLDDEVIAFEETEMVTIDKLSDEELNKKMESFIVEDPGMVLGVGEKCFYQGFCYSMRLKNVVTGTSGNSMHIGGRNALGMYLSAGTSQRSYDRSTVTEKYPGNFFITNNRMVCNALKFAFEIKLTNITSLTAYSDALVITVKDKSYIIETKEIGIIKEILAVNNEGMRRLAGNSKIENSNSRKTNDDEMQGEDKIVQLLREYKNLYDEGIITEEEFINKKKQLLKNSI